MAEVNSPAARPEIPGEIWPDGDLPEQFGGQYTTLMPGSDTFRLPLTLPQLWSSVEITDGNPHSPTTGQKVTRLSLRFDRDNPLVVEGGPRDGQTLTASFSGNPRPRGKKDDPNTLWISDLAYLLAIGLGSKARPATPDQLKAEINKYSGKTIRLEHGLSAHCREDKPRYILSADGQTAIPDPDKTMGCGERFYTKDFTAKDEKGGNIFLDTVLGDCGAVLRGFPNVERFLTPLAGAGAAK